MTKTLAILLAIASPLLLVSTPAFATKGIDAARACEAQPRCVVTYFDDGSIVIFKGDTFIECAGPQADCKVMIKPATDTSTPITDGPKKR